MAFHTTDYHRQRFFPASVEDKLVGMMGRAAGAALLSFVALAWISLATWTIQDPSLTLATSGPVQNMAGAPGAILADLLLQMLGLGAMLALFAPMFWGVELLRTCHVTAFRSKVAFFPLSVVVCAGALSAMSATAGWPLEHGYGGILGDFTFGLVSGVFEFLNPERAGLATGFLLAVIGLSTLMHSLGLELRDLHRILFQPIRRVNWREKAGSWQHTLLSEAKRVRDNVRESLEVNENSGDERAELKINAESDVPTKSELDKNDDHTKRSVEAGSAPRIIVSPQNERPSTVQAVAAPKPMMMQRPHPAQRNVSSPSFIPHQQTTMTPAPRHGTFGQPQAALGPTAMQPALSYGVARNTWLHPAPPHPMAQRTPSPMPRLGTQTPPRHATSPQHAVTQPRLPETTPHPISHPGDTRQTQALNSAPARTVPAPLSHSRSQGAGSMSIADQFAAHVAQTKPSPIDDVEEEDVYSSREMARRFAPSATPVEHAEISNPGPQSPRSSAHEVKPAGSAMPPLMNAKSATRSAKPKYAFPSTHLLARAKPLQALAEQAAGVLRQHAEDLQTVLADFGIQGSIRNIRPGPVVTLYEFEPARGIKSSRIIALADDIARSMSAVSARVAVVPGRNAIGIELPNSERRPVLLRELLESNAYRGSNSALPLTLGKSIGGEAVVADLARMPHLLVAGTTGSGKSVGVNAMVLSILYKHAPDTCRLLMIDPKMLELSVYNDIPHLLSPVITDPQKAVVALNWAVREMEERYKRMSKLSVRNIGVYNNRVRNAKKRGESLSRTVHTGFDASGQAIYENETMQLEELPHIVIVVDEFADLMLVAGKDIEAAIQRLAQMARAAGIHLIMATQRPSVDVITGTIKANFPTRISFKVTSKVDSRTILNEQGAEQLLGQGDMLYASGSGQTVRVHGPFVSDEEVEAIAAHLKTQGAPNYVSDVTEAPEPPPEPHSDQSATGENLYDQAVAIVIRDRKASTSYIQRRLSIGYNRAANLIERMEDEGLIGPAGAGGKREILAPTNGASKSENAA